MVGNDKSRLPVVWFLQIAILLVSQFSSSIPDMVLLDDIIASSLFLFEVCFFCQPSMTVWSFCERHSLVYPSQTEVDTLICCCLSAGFYVYIFISYSELVGFFLMQFSICPNQMSNTNAYFTLNG